jgi:hypothetical protein
MIETTFNVDIDPQYWYQCRGFVAAYNNVIALTGTGTGSVMATTFFVHMSLGFVTIVLAAIGLLGLYTVSNITAR